MDDKDFAFVITRCGESDAQMAQVVSGLDRHYLTSQVFIISDYHTRLKRLECGTQWWLRFLSLDFKESVRWVVKIDPDAMCHRILRHEPSEAVCGTMQADGTIQGGVQFIARGIIPSLTRVFKYGDFSLEKWATADHVRRYALEKEQISTDYTLAHALRIAGIAPADFSEVDSLWKPTRPFREGVAFTHPHKVP